MKNKEPAQSGSASGTAASETARLLAANPTPSNVEAVRAMPFAREADIKSPPPGYVPFSRDNPPNLRLVADDRRAEAKNVLEEAVRKGPQFTIDLGRHAPKVQLASALLGELEEAHASRLKAERYANYCANKEQVLLSDVGLFIDAEKKELLHEMEHNPGLRQEYPHAMKYFEQVGGAISEGMAASPKVAARRKDAAATLTAAEGTGSPAKK